MQLAMMATTEWNGELVADLQPERARLRKAEVVRVTRGAAADQARLGSNEFQVRLVAQPLGFGDGKLTLVDATRGRLDRVCVRY